MLSSGRKFTARALLLQKWRHRNMHSVTHPLRTASQWNAAYPAVVQGKLLCWGFVQFGNISLLISEALEFLTIFNIRYLRSHTTLALSGVKLHQNTSQEQQPESRFHNAAFIPLFIALLLCMSYSSISQNLM